jgi:hypothetical protein
MAVLRGGFTLAATVAAKGLRSANDTITVPNSTEMGSYGSYDTTTIDKDITAVMGVTFRVQ